ncbi:hypothetical protein M514_18162, partial [Trichuris suis]
AYKKQLPSKVECTQNGCSILAATDGYSPSLHHVNWLHQLSTQKLMNELENVLQREPDDLFKEEDHR